MATINYTYTGARPNIIYTITCNCTRKSNTQITYSGTVTWNLRYSDSHIGTGYVLQCKATSSTGGDTGWISFTEYGKVYSGTTKRSFNYSFTASNSSANVSDKVTFSFRNNSNYDSNYNSWSTYTNFSTPALLWTNCTAPTSVSSTAKSVITPGTLTVSWSGASNGVDNVIKNYTVYWVISSTDGQVPTTSWYTGKATTSNSSYNISIPEDYRGQYISVKIQANATYNSPISSDYVRRSVNSRPNTPLTSGSVTIKSTASSAIIKVTPGNANFGSNSTSVYYASSVTGIKSYAGDSISVPRNSTYYFWTWDGLEYSNSYTTATVTANVPPVIKVSLDGNPTLSSNSNYANKKIIEDIAFKIAKPSKNCYYGLNIYNKSGTFLKTWIADAWITTETPVSLNARSIGLPSGEYYFAFSCKDNLENGNSVRFPSEDNDFYYIPPLPDFSTTYNQFNTSNIEGTKSEDFYTHLRFTTTFYDSYLYENGSFRLNNSNNESIAYSIKKSKNSENTEIYYDVTFTTSLMPGTSYTFLPSIQVGGSSNFGTVIRRQCPILDPTPSSGSSINIKPFTTGYDVENSKAVSMTQKIIISNNTGNTNETDFFNNLNINKNVKWWTSEIIVDNKAIDITNLVSGLEIGSNDFIKRSFTITGDNFYNLLTSNNIEKKGIKTCILKNSVINRFGRIVSGQSSNVILDFNENPTIISLLKIADNTEYLYENGTLKLQYKYRTYSENQISYSYLINRNDGKGVVTYGDIVKGPTKTIPEFGKGRIITETVIIPIGEITSSKICQFNMRFYDGSITSYDKNLEVSCKRIKFISPSLSFNKGIYGINGDGQPKIDCSYIINDWGYDTTQKEDKVFSTSFELTLNYSDEKKTNENDNPTTYLLKEEISDFIVGKLTLTVYLTYNNKKLRKTSTSNELIIYGISPTVAYRQNYLGINTNSIQSDEVLRVAPATGRNIITFLKADGSNNIMTLNLETGTLIGFNINWENITNLPSIIDCGEIT